MLLLYVNFRRHVDRSFLLVRTSSSFEYIEVLLRFMLYLLICRSICGSRVRVEFSTGKSKSKPWQRRGAPSAPPRRAFDPEDRCYECGQRGHYAYDCRYRREKELASYL